MDFLLVALFFGSLLTIALAVDGDTENHFWIFFMPITWFCLALIGIGAMFFGLYKITVEPFNNWLNNKNDTVK
jgi:hypothetical protein